MQCRISPRGCRHVGERCDCIHHLLRRWRRVGGEPTQCSAAFHPLCQLLQFPPEHEEAVGRAMHFILDCLRQYFREGPLSPPAGSRGDADAGDAEDADDADHDDADGADCLLVSGAVKAVMMQPHFPPSTTSSASCGAGAIMESTPPAAQSHRRRRCTTHLLSLASTTDSRPSCLGQT